MNYVRPILVVRCMNKRMETFVYTGSALKIEGRKVFYRSNRGAKDGKSMAFASDLPLWPGSNMITVVARANTEVKSVKTMFVYRDPPRTAQTSAPATTTTSR